MFTPYLGEDEPNLTFVDFSDGLKLNHQPVLIQSHGIRGYLGPLDPRLSLLIDIGGLVASLGALW